MIRNLLLRNSGAEIEFLTIRIQADLNSIPTFVFLCECPGIPTILIIYGGGAGVT